MIGDDFVELEKTVDPKNNRKGIKVLSISILLFQLLIKLNLEVLEDMQLL